MNLTPTPEALRGPGAVPELSRAELEDLALLPTHPSRREPDWTKGLAAAWVPGEEGAWQRLEAFCHTMVPGSGPGYSEGRDLPSLSVTSRFSPHLRFGEISPRTVWAKSASAGSRSDFSVFHSELMWRDFAWHRLYHRPDLATANVRPEFDRFAWSWDPQEFTETTAGGRDGRRSAQLHGPGGGRRDPLNSPDFREELSDWRSGTTGIPLVDAGMRELWHTGHMHNRVRMVVASFLTKNLGIHWHHGEEWFWDTLVDADAASNPFNWQWAAGCGDDASPYFRIFNPETQARRFDPDNTYTTGWIPELSSPHYPDPVVDLRESRIRALAAYEDIRR